MTAPTMMTTTTVLQRRRRRNKTGRVGPAKEMTVADGRRSSSSSSRADSDSWNRIDSSKEDSIHIFQQVSDGWMDDKYHLVEEW
mmetsp:Transcript_51265/g.57279  ORF Transcript_51265/g.57279 Transcript_51265/m.57279 type:complete len:84 (+) Transcript_51265:142-393(+)